MGRDEMRCMCGNGDGVLDNSPFSKEVDDRWFITRKPRHTTSSHTRVCAWPLLLIAVFGVRFSFVSRATTEHIRIVVVEYGQTIRIRVLCYSHHWIVLLH
jgi:hypothetical protein